MKCIKKGDDIKRLKDERAYKMVAQGWSFCPKSEWKGKGRALSKEDIVEEVKIKKTNKTKKMNKKFKENNVKKDIIEKPEDKK